MKKKIIIIVAVVVVVVGAILIASLYYPPSKGEDSAGTIGRAERFRNGQYTEDDILLRDNILEDTAAVGKTLHQILEFDYFMQQEIILIDTFWIGKIQKYCAENTGKTDVKKCEEAVKILQDYTTFLKNNKETVKNTCEVLLAAYNGKQKTLEFDPGIKILTFVQFIDQMLDRDSVLSQAIILVDQHISGQKTAGKEHQSQLAKLKQSRDYMVLDNLFIAIKTGDKKQRETALSLNLYNVVAGQQSVLKYVEVCLTPKNGSVGVQISPVGNLEFGAAAQNVKALARPEVDLVVESIEKNGVSCFMTTEKSWGLFNPIASGIAAIRNIYLYAGGMVFSRDMGAIASSVGMTKAWVASNVAGNEINLLELGNLPEFQQCIRQEPIILCFSFVGTIFNSTAMGALLTII